jgi:sirohydrochlorin ferrochelatase
LSRPADAAAAPARAVLLIDHGTRDPKTNARLADFTRRVAERRPDWIVAHAHMELGEPDLGQAVASLVDAGAKEIRVQPHFLTSGYHVTTSIPALIEEAKAHYPDVTFELISPIGEDEGLIDLVVARIPDADH